MPRLRWLFFASLSVILMLQLRGLDLPLHSPETPWGIVGFELAFTRARAQAMIDAWRMVDAIEAARVSLGVDFGFLLVYPWFFRVSIEGLRLSAVPATMDSIGRRLESLVLLCTPLDAIENLALWRQVSSEATGALALTAGITATFKFLLVMLASAWCAAALGQRLRYRQR